MRAFLKVPLFAISAEFSETLPSDTLAEGSTTLYEYIYSRGGILFLNYLAICPAYPENKLNLFLANIMRFPCFKIILNNLHYKTKNMVGAGVRYYASRFHPVLLIGYGSFHSLSSISANVDFHLTMMGWYICSSIPLSYPVSLNETRFKKCPLVEPWAALRKLVVLQQFCLREFWFIADNKTYTLTFALLISIYFIFKKTIFSQSLL